MHGLPKNFNTTFPPLSEFDQQCFIADPLASAPEDIPCTEQEIFNLLNALDTNKASGPDGISGRMLKGTAVSITPALTELFNLNRQRLNRQILQWIASYLSNRQQYVVVNGAPPGTIAVVSSVPQGSVLALQFLIYVNHR